MSSTKSQPQITRVVPSSERAIVVAVPAMDESDFGGFVHAIVLGVLIGVPAVAVFVAMLVKFAWPDVSTAGLIAIVTWVAVWTGVFLGGTVTVGLWSAKQHQH